MIDREKINKILKIKGKIRGDVLKTDFKYILEKQGQKSLEELNKQFRKIDENFDYYKIKNTEWIPLSWKIILMETSKLSFKWTDQDIFALGYSASSNSFITRTLIRYFISTERTFQESPKYWEKYWGIGKLEPHYIDLDKKYLVIRLKNFEIHPDLCIYMRGHFKAFAELLLRKKVEIKETKCSFKKESFHEFEIKWD